MPYAGRLPPVRPLRLRHVRRASVDRGDGPIIRSAAIGFDDHPKGRDVSHFRFQEYPQDVLDECRARFRDAKPFPHIVFDDVIASSPEDVLSAFPTNEWQGWSRWKDAYQAAKMYCDEIELIPEPLSSMVREMNSPAQLRFLEFLTGTPKLIPDPYLQGGGLHCSGVGGILAPHTDFHLHRALDIYRRYNLIIYLNPDWQESNGGSLQLFEEGTAEPAVTIVPRWGRCVIFATDDRSVHGFTEPISGEADLYRRSMALYYYTSREADRFSGDINTYWRQHGNLNGTKLGRLMLYKALLFTARGFSSLAYRTNPALVPPDLSDQLNRPE